MGKIPINIKSATSSRLFKISICLALALYSEIASTLIKSSSSKFRVLIFLQRPNISVSGAFHDKLQFSLANLYGIPFCSPLVADVALMLRFVN